MPLRESTTPSVEPGGITRLRRPGHGVQRVAALGLAALVLTVGPQAASAKAEGSDANARVEAVVAADGSITVNQTLDFPDGAPKDLTQTIQTRTDADDGAYYEHQVDEVSAKVGAKQVTPQLDQGDAQTRVRVPEAAGQSEVTISYTVVGAAHQSPAAQGQRPRTEVQWDFLQGWSVPVRQVSGTINTPGTISFVTCESGAPGLLSPCSTFGGGTHESPQPSFTDGPRAAGDVVQVGFALPSSLVQPNETVKHHWSLDRAFSVNRNTLLASLLPLLLGGALLWLLHRRTGRDVAHGGRVTPVAEFRPVGAGESEFTVLHDVRPGHVGTVADEHVDPVDITATLLDLAVRGWLRIIELPDAPHKPLDWTFERLEGGRGELRPFEQRLRDAVAPADHRPAQVSQITEAINPVVEQVQDELYADVVQRGWFDRNPDQTRNRWTVLGWSALAVAIIATVLLVVFTTFGLVGFALTALALGALLIGQQMPRRTTEGTALLAGLSALAGQLQTQPTTNLPAGRELEELSQILPYTVVLGGRERWIRAIVAADDDATPDPHDLAWYHAPGDWHLQDLPESLESFIVTVQGKLFGR
ncbi:DUF2207 family protein [Luteococcus sp. OSA5]|uniref:DUF2207 family protein n=1 Tax=Luteococcus sp. OSA5 TaxID=3401630 RepID=UPI003B42ED6F